MDTGALEQRLRALHVRLRERGFYPYLLFACVVLAVWVPGGFNVGPYKIEDLALLRDHSGNGGLLDPMVTRLFRDVPVWLGLHLTPGSLVGWQWMLLLLAFARGALFYGIVRRMLPGQELFALLAGLLALFQPADAGYFYVNTSGEQFALAASLAGCLCAVDYLHSGRRRMLVGMALAELLAGFTYNGFLPLLVAIPAGAWVLKWLREGRRPKPARLALVCAVPLVLLGVSLAFISQKVGRDSGVADFELKGMLQGYAFAAGRIALAWGELARGFKPAYLPSLAVAAAAGLALGRAHRPEGDAPPAGSRALHAVAVGGLLLLAAVSYLPFSLSTLRFADRRQLLMAGVFAYSAALYLLLMLLGSRLGRRWVAAGLVALMSVAVTLTGLEKREYLLERYHGAEALVAAVAAAVPNPASGSFILVQLQNRSQVRAVQQMYGMELALTVMLRHLYGDPSLQAGFTVSGKHQARFDDKGVLTHLTLHGRHDTHRVYAGYDRLIVVYYPRRGPARVLGAPWLAKAGVAKPEVPYEPGRLIHAGPGRSIACTFLEPDYRPDYCKGTRPRKGRPPAAPATATGSSPAAGTR